MSGITKTVATRAQDNPLKLMCHRKVITQRDGISGVFIGVSSQPSFAGLSMERLRLACAGPHIFCRYDDGEVVHNIECTNNSQGGFQSHPDEHYQQSRGIPDVAIECGSDLRALTPRQMLGLFIGLRGRHREDTGLMAEAETDYLLARTLFPENRRLYMSQVGVSVQLSDRRFHVGEAGHHTRLARWLWAEANHSSHANEIEAGIAINVGG